MMLLKSEVLSPVGAGPGKSAAVDPASIVVGVVEDDACGTGSLFEGGNARRFIV